MKLSLPALALAFTALVTAQWEQQSDPFYLVLESDDKSVNGHSLSACHEGAGIEGVCIAGVFNPKKPEGVLFHFNYSSQISEPSPGLGKPGILTWLLVGGNFEVDSGLRLSADPTTNVGHPQFYPGPDSAQTVAFNSKNYLAIQGYVDDSVSPPVAGPTKNLESWYACTSYYSGYTNLSLNWVYGLKATPQNPTCNKVRVRRVFAKKN